MYCEIYYLDDYKNKHLAIVLKQDIFLYIERYTIINCSIL